MAPSAQICSRVLPSLPIDPSGPHLKLRRVLEITTSDQSPTCGK